MLKKVIFIILILFLFLSIKPFYLFVFHANIVKANALQYKTSRALIYAVIFEESRFNKNAISSKGAVGLMQIMPQTAKEIASKLKINKYLLKDPYFNIKFGTYYLNQLLKKYNYDLVLALTAYNAGQTVVDEWLKTKGYLLVTEIPYPETKKYVANILRNFQLLSKWIT
ncbi:MAG: lytic transglycosylase domain-containing protein [bacterium]|nr:lytic transglycosylase domain-containing protein [bacterium]